ncbi:Armadillo repeat-containing protein 8, partial [Quaeritorhiza haematococci]
MSHPRNVGIRSAACACTRSLSRSVKNLRTNLVDAGVAIPLFGLLSDENVTVRTTASATLCNIVLDFSPMKKTVLENGGVEKLVQLVRRKRGGEGGSRHGHETAQDAWSGGVGPEHDQENDEGGLRLNAVWALKNLLYQADSDIKAKVMRELGWDHLYRLIVDDEIGMQEQALNLLRNLACGKQNDIENVFNGIGEERLVGILEDKLMNLGEYEEIILQTLYIVVNVATGNERHKRAMMNSEKILRNVVKYLSHPKSAIRIASTWCIINLTWTDDVNFAERVGRLREMGVETALREMVEDPDIDVKDRVRTALNHFGSGEAALGGAT